MIQASRKGIKDAEDIDKFKIDFCFCETQTDPTETKKKQHKLLKTRSVDNLRRKEILIDRGNRAHFIRNLSPSKAKNKKEKYLV